MNKYPMKATIDGAIVRNCRLVSSPEETTLWCWDKDADEARVLRSIPGAPERVGATQSWRVGDVVVDPQRGCGCQHPMYSFLATPEQV